jgi:hypothetical protein
LSLRRDDGKQTGGLQISAAQVAERRLHLVTISNYQRFQWMPDMLEKEGIINSFSKRQLSCSGVLPDIIRR